MKNKKRKKAGVPPPPPPKAAEESLPRLVKILCPICQTHWANANIQFGAEIRQEHFSPREDLKKIRFQANGLPVCPLCNFKYDEKAMYSLLIAAANEEALEKRLWKQERYNPS